MNTIRTDRFSHIVPFNTFHLRSQVTQFNDGLIHEFLCSYVQYPPLHTELMHKNLNHDILLFHVSSRFVLPTIKFHLNPGCNRIEINLKRDA